MANLKSSSATSSSSDSKTYFDPKISTTPDLPVIDWSVIGMKAPELLDTATDYLPEADAIVITWAGAEWAALEHVFCSSHKAMPYSYQHNSTWDGWKLYTKNAPFLDPSKGWYYWGYYRLVKVGNRKVLLFKSNTHLDFPGEDYLETLIKILIREVKPKLLLSIGTAGGARTTDHEGTVNVVSSGTYYVDKVKQDDWINYGNKWKANWKLIGQDAFAKLLFPIPVTEDDLKSLCKQFNAFYYTPYTVSQYNVLGLDYGDLHPQINDMTKEPAMPLLTTGSFVVANSWGNYKDFACVEMDDAVIGNVCNVYNIPFGFVRNISDPVQNAELPTDVQGNWGGCIYKVYGMYTSYNGALAACALLMAEFG